MDQPSEMLSAKSHSRILSGSEPLRCLDLLQLQQLEESFRRWAKSPGKTSLQLSRKRIFLIFLLIRYTGARLNEVLSLDPSGDIDCDKQVVRFRKTGAGDNVPLREVQIPEMLSAEIRKILQELLLTKAHGKNFWVDPSHVRRKFYERAEAIGISRELGTPEIIRRSRAVELMQSDVPLPVVQKILGHSTPNLAASYVEFSDDEIQRAARYFADRESRRKTSARNAFFGKIDTVQIGDVQTVVELVSLGGSRVCSIITNYSQQRLGLKPGTLATAEVKAPWVALYKGEEEPHCSADNRYCGKVCRITRGKLMTEIIVRIPDSTELCSIITEKSKQTLNIKEDDTVWVAFSAFSVVIHTD
ncbi:MAG: TOBE domain-containing protein [Syntrophobacteraceae bacterium]